MGAIGGRDHEAVGSRERRALNIIGDCRAPYHHHTSRIGRIMKLINYDPTRSIPRYKIYVQRVVGHFYDYAGSVDLGDDVIKPTSTSWACAYHTLTSTRPPLCATNPTAYRISRT